MGGEHRNLEDYLAEAVQRYLDEQCGGGMATAWFFFTDFILPDGDSRWMWTSPPEQRVWQSMGLLAFAEKMNAYEANRGFEENGGT